MLDDDACGVTFTVASTGSFTSFTDVESEPVLICEDNGVPVADLPVLVFGGKWKSICVVLD